jgi:hypothetical protein
MGGQHGIGGTYHEPPPVADYNVATNPELDPDCSCNYFLAGTHDGKPYYRREDGLFYLWYYQMWPIWIISTEISAEPSDFWGNETSILGDYGPFGSCRGIATVSAGPH